MSTKTPDIRRILLFCIPGIGDSLLATPAFRALKKTYPEARITALTTFPGAAEMLRHCPDIDEVRHFDFAKEGKLRSLLYLLRLRKERFDVTFLTYPGNRLKYNIMPPLVGPKIRLGHRYNHLDFSCGNWLNSRSVREVDTLTNIEENLRLVELLTGETCTDHRPAFELGSSHIEYARQWIAKNGLENRLLVAFHAGGSIAENHINKRWPPEYFIELGRILAICSEAFILLLGGPEEDPLKSRVVRGIGPRAFSVCTPNVLNTCAIMARCVHLVSNDTALLHLGAALGVPATAIFGPTNPMWVRMPGASRKEVTLGLPCQPCFHHSPRRLHCRFGDFHCLRQLPPDAVAKIVLAQLPPGPLK